MFDIDKQVDGLESKRKSETFEHDPIESAQRLVDEYMNSPDICHQSGRAVYYPALDYISVPPLKDFREAEKYYSVLFHELVHSTGHKDRLARKGATKVVSFGDEVYPLQKDKQIPLTLPL